MKRKNKTLISFVIMMGVGLSLLFTNCTNQISLCNDCERIRSISNLIVRFEAKIDSVKHNQKIEFGTIKSLTAIKEGLEQNRLLLTKLCLEELGAKIHNEIIIKNHQVIWQTNEK